MANCDINIPVDKQMRAKDDRLDKYQPTPTTTVEDITSSLEDTAKEWKLKYDPEQDREIYTSVIDDTKLANRVTDKVSREFERRNGVAVAKAIRESNDTKIKGATGTVVHNAAEKIMNFYSKGEGDLKSIKKEYKNQLTSKGIQNLISGVEEIYNQIQTKQKEIDPEGEVKILTEQVIVNRKTDEGGSIDILAVYSDKTASIFDYKNKFPSSLSTDKKNRLIENVIYPGKREEYGLQLGTYEKTLKDIYGIKDVRQARVVPIRVDLTKVNKKLTSKVTLLEIGKEQSPHLMQFPVLPETTRYESVNEYIKEKFSRIEALKEKAKGKDEVARKRIYNKIASISNTIESVLSDNDLKVIGRDLNLTLDYLNENLYKRNEDGTRVVDLPELLEYSEELEYYSNIRSIFADYLRDLKRAGNTTKVEEVESTIREAQQYADATLSDVRHEIKELAKVEIDKRDLDAQGNIIETKELGIWDKTVKRLSQINHPAFRAFKNLVDKANIRTRKKVLAFNEKVSTVYNNAKAHASSLGITENQMVEKLIDYKTGNFYSRYQTKFWEYTDNIIGSKDTAKFNSTYKLKASKEETAEKIKKEKALHKKVYEQDTLAKQRTLGEKSEREIDYMLTQEMKRWDSQNNVLKSSDAKFIRRNIGKYYELDTDKLTEFETPEYKYIANNKPFLDFYKFIQESNAEFRDILQINYKDIPSNFFPNVRKDMLQKVLDNGLLGASSGTSEIIDSLTVREEDVFLGTRNSNTGELNRNIPVMYVNPLRKDGGTAEKSYDIVNSLLLFGKMAYNYEHVNAIEAPSLALKETIAAGSRLETNAKGNVVKDKWGKWVKSKVGIASDEVTLFNSFLDYHLYGIKYKEKDVAVNVLGKDISAKKTFLSMKNAFALKTLGLAAIPGAAAGIQALTGAKVEASKGILYNNEQWVKSIQMFGKNPTKALKLARELDIFTEDVVDRLIHKAQNKTRQIVSSRSMFAFFRTPDEAVDVTVFYSMLQNYGFDGSGNLRRLENIPDAKPILNVETGELNYKLDESQQIAIRNAVKAGGLKVKGAMSNDDINHMSTNLLMSAFGQFKTWMPAILGERFGNAEYNRTIDSFEMGRYRALANDLGKPEEASMLAYLSQIIAPKILMMSTELATFGLLSPYSNVKKGQLDIKSMSTHQLKLAKNRYDKFITQNPNLENTITFEQFVLSQQRNIKGAMGDIQAMILMSLIVLALGSDWDDDGEENYKELGWAGRTMWKVFNRASAEVSFTLNPQEFINLTKNPLPISRLLVDVAHTISNTADETRDLILGENSPQDKTPIGYYSTKWIFGMHQFRNIFDWLYEGDQRNKYK